MVGAGPAGCVAAMFLSRQGFRVRVLERRSDPTAPNADVNRATFIMALMPRGINALKDVRNIVYGQCLFRRALFCVWHDGPTTAPWRRQIAHAAW